MKKVIPYVLVLTLAFYLSGCAVIFKGGTQEIPVSSKPSGAEILVDGVSYGKTPLKLHLKVNKTYTITIRKDGKERNFMINNHVGTLWIVLDVLSGFVPLIVDAATGDWYELQPGQISVDLTQ